MTPNEAYRKGQYDMRRKIERYWRAYHIRGLGMLLDPKAHPANRKAFNGSRVDLNIRRKCKMEDLQETTRT